ncbi:polysaccharide pyruvyl transferase family protein [Aquisalibacillus elongatus]|uniref:Polysaccharide pyruvyl transferase WcaK-like protein n=1 Tax=Aquisalibacillus elongatus TaxID=485577 RepID=A0A3N5B9X2_9BACI|nr:polysaccharide pyruvyl transferase family protein [Aquisalibacillus elongatus]RPF54203.1 polysaccharide pyruvyl transferase WcaK-like protein [Aquisalibacillus elongatus]
MKIGIIGSYGGGSIGDEAILNGLINSLNDLGDSVKEVVIYTTNIDNTKYALNLDGVKFDIVYKGNISKKKSLNTNENKSLVKSYHPRSLVNNLKKRNPIFYHSVESYMRQLTRKPIYGFNLDKDLDYLIVGGGNVLMDFYPKWPFVLRHIVKEARKKDIKVYFCGVGAGPINTSVGKKVIKSILKDYYVSTRDIESKYILDNLNEGSKCVKVNTDLAFGLERKLKTKSNGIGVSVIPFHADYYWPNNDSSYYKIYCENMSKILDNLIMKTSIPITFFATNYPSDIKVAKHIYNNMSNKGSVEILDKRLTVHEILEFCASKKLILGTRLHSLILSSCARTNFYGINYQPKVNYFLKRIGKCDDYININDLLKDLSDIEIGTITDKIILQLKAELNEEFLDDEKEKIQKELSFILNK